MHRPKTPHVIAGMVVLLAGCLVVRQMIAPHRRFFTTQRPGEPARVWRSMRTAWKFDPGIEGYHSQISDMLVRGGRLYYVCECEAGCLDAASGTLLWRHPFVTPQTAATQVASPLDGQKLIATDLEIYVTAGGVLSTGWPRPNLHMLALEAETGRTKWDLSERKHVADRVRLAGRLLLAPMEDGAVRAYDRTTGRLAWDRPIASASPRTMKDGTRFVLASDGNIAVAEIGSSRLVAFRLEDGAALWSRQPPDPQDRADNAEPVVQGGVAYVQTDSREVEALETATGHRIWARRAPSASGMVELLATVRDVVVMEVGGTEVAIGRRDGHTQWVEDRRNDETRESNSPWVQNPYVDGSGESLFEIWNGPPVIEGAERQFRSLPSLSTLVARDLRTGRDRWRWQPDEGYRIERTATDGARFFLSDGQSIHAVEDGVPDPQPTSTNARRALAGKMMVAQLCQGWALGSSPPPPYRSESPRISPWHIVRQLLAGKGFPDDERHDDRSAILMLLRLGPDSVPALLDFIDSEVGAELGRPARYAERMSFSMHDTPPLLDALNFLVDIGDPSAIQPLMRCLTTAKQAETRKLLAEALLRFHDPAAASALFQFAQSAANDPDTREAALYRACRTPDSALPQAEVTRYLIGALTNQKGSARIRLFARFELLNDRGEEASRLAIRSFAGEGRVEPWPEPVAITNVDENQLSGPTSSGFPTMVQFTSRVKDGAGRWWAAFRTDYLGSFGDRWVAQSTDGKRWTRPAFVMNLTDRCAPGHLAGETRIHVHDGLLELTWKEVVSWDDTSRVTLHHDRIPMADLYRDSDGDGLPDRLERAIGTDPLKRDTNGDGVPDGLDKNPAYREHALSDEEGIVKAVVEALCQTGRTTTNRHNPYVSELPVRYGGCSRPLLVPLPPGSRGIKILGHTGPVVFRPNHFGALYEPGSPDYGDGFTPPNVDLAGRYHEMVEWQRAGSRVETPGDPFEEKKTVAAPPASHIPGFRDYFPYERSEDGTRARIGWVQTGSTRGGITHVNYDIEVRKIEGRWVPVECRRIQPLHNDSLREW